MIDFSQAYCRADFVNYLRRDFLPDDFEQEESNVPFWTQMNYASAATCLGKSKTLDLVVYEIKHTSRHDARVGLSKDAFRMLAGEKQSRALVIFVPEDDANNYRFSLIEIQLSITENDSNVTRTYSNPRRYSYYLGQGIACYTPNKYLNELGRVKDVEDLFERFSVEVLTKAFYQELSDWYAWAIKVISFPNDITSLTDDKLHNHEGAIRLITRLIFVWFLKERKLIPWQFFDQEYIATHLIKGFNPHKMDNLFGKSQASVYYRAILQNLFFAMLNCPITKEGSTELTERRFKDNRSQFDDNKLMRYRDEFNDPDTFLRLANETVPFLNGGLFDCLDEKRTGMYYDGFSERKDSMRQLVVPDYLFFGEEAGKNIDLSEFYGDVKKKKVSARGIIDILKRYNFTVEENMPFDKDVSLDPELLGKVFENLLASYNPETQQTARKQTGSFYTPREIVQYMVDESLVAHLKRTVGDELEDEYRKLLDYTDNETTLTEQLKLAIMQSLYNCKILDPACGSGAFPVGILQQMVHILKQVDPDNSRWKNMLMQFAIDETSEAYLTSTAEERREAIADIERAFDEKVNYPDYARKLHLIENCIYGVDIQPIAIQISKLRFFISLVIDQKRNNNPADNFGIRPLPNLEAKFVAANSLLGLKRTEATLFDSEEIKQKERQLKIAKHKIFSARRPATKEKWRNEVVRLRQEIADLLLDNDCIGNEQAAQLAKWDMFDQNSFAPFFDPEWMFGVKRGFDIVIGNPPYVQVKKGLVRQSEYPYSEGKDTGKQNLYKLFIETAYNKLSLNGSGCLIVQSSIMGDVSATYTRELLLTKCSLDFVGEFPKTIKKGNEDRAFAGVLQGTCILLFHKTPDATSKVKISIGNSRQSIAKPKYGVISAKEIFDFSPLHEIPLVCIGGMNLYKKVKSIPTRLSDFLVDSAQGNINTIHLPKIQSFVPTDIFIAKGAHIGDFEIRQKDLYYGAYNALTEPIVSKNLGKHFILTQNITGTTDEKRIHAVSVECNSTKLVLLHSVNISYLPSPTLAKYICGVLNSKLIDWIFRVTSTNNHVNIYELNNLPIPDLNKLYAPEILKTVDAIIAAEKESSEYKVVIEKLNFLVYHLYELTYDEVLIVDPDTPITREEYDNFNL